MTTNATPGLTCTGGVDSIMHGTLPCGRPAIREAKFLGFWRPLCRYHVGSFSDLPQRSVSTERR